MSYHVAIIVTNDPKRDEENFRAEAPDFAAAVAMVQRAHSMLVNPITVKIQRSEVREQVRTNRGRGAGRGARR